MRSGHASPDDELAATTAPSAIRRAAASNEMIFERVMPSPFRVRASRFPRWPKSITPGCRISARISADSTSRGPGRLKYWLTVDHRHAPRADRMQGLPAGQPLERRRFGAGAREVEAARHRDDHVRIGGAHGLPLEPRRMLADGAEEVPAAGERDQLRHPVARRHQRIEPLDARDARPREIAGARGERGEPVAQPRDDRRAACRHAERRADALDVGEHVVQTRRSERNDANAAPRPVARRGDDVGLGSPRRPRTASA